jgi:hypothetical protein
LQFAAKQKSIAGFERDVEGKVKADKQNSTRDSFSI